MPTVSVLVLARDEAPTIARAIRSTEGLASEVIVGVDTTTTDDTAAIARGCGARVVPIVFRGDFAAAHNRLDGAASGEWALKLDGHEALVEEHAGRLREVMALPDTGSVLCRLETSFVEGSERAMVRRAYRRGPGSGTGAACTRSWSV